MKIKNAILFCAVALLTSFSLIASSDLYEPTSNSTAVEEIKALIKDISFDLSALDAETVKVQFMINADDEIIILQTNDKRVDRKIKNHMNYARIKNNDLEINKIYIIPVSFQSDTAAG